MELPADVLSEISIYAVFIDFYNFLKSCKSMYSLRTLITYHCFIDFLNRFPEWLKTRSTWVRGIGNFPMAKKLALAGPSPIGEFVEELTLDYMGGHNVHMICSKSFPRKLRILRYNIPRLLPPLPNTIEKLYIGQRYADKKYLINCPVNLKSLTVPEECMILGEYRLQKIKIIVDDFRKINLIDFSKVEKVIIILNKIRAKMLKIVKLVGAKKVVVCGPEYYRKMVCWQFDKDSSVLFIAKLSTI